MAEKETTSTRTWLAIAVVFTVIWAAYLTFFGPRPPKPSLDGPGPDVKASYDWSISDLEGRRQGFDQFKGKVVFLNIWATWCGPCVREMPSIARLAEDPRLEDRGIAFVCVSVDDETATVREFLRGKSWPMRFFRSQDMPRVFATDGIPATFIIAPDGRIDASQVGSAEWDNPEVVARLEKLAAGRRTDPP